MLRVVNTVNSSTKCKSSGRSYKRTVTECQQKNKFFVFHFQRQETVQDHQNHHRELISGIFNDPTIHLVSEDPQFMMYFCLTRWFARNCINTSWIGGPLTPDGSRSHKKSRVLVPMMFRMIPDNFLALKMKNGKRTFFVDAQSQPWYWTFAFWGLE